MLLNKYLKKFLNKKSKNSSINALASIRNIMDIPKKEEFSHDKKSLELIEQYKKEYLKTLRLKRTITSMDLNNEELHNYKNIYADLLANLCTEDLTDVSFEKIDKKSSELLKIMLIKLKLDIYIDEVKKLENEAKLRIIALTDILDKIIFSRSKERAVNNEIDNLLFARSIFMRQIIAMEKEKENFLKDLDNLALDEFNNKEQEAITKEYLDELELIAKSIMPEKLIELKKLNLNPLALIAKLEQLLEIYVYTHENIIDILREEVHKTAFDLSRCILGGTIEEFWKVVENQDEKLLYENFLKRIKGIELIFKIFSKYGRNIIFKSDLEELYQVKFKLLTKNIYNNNFNILDNITFTELEIYQDIIAKKIERILKGDNPYVNEYLLQPYKKRIINCIKQVLKLEKNEFSMYEILKNRRTLCFLVAIDNNNLEEFFKKEKVLKEDYSNINFYDRTIFSWEETLPLDTIFRIMKSNTKTDYVDDKEKEPLYQLWLTHQYILDFIFAKKSRMCYYLPEGLTGIHVYSIGKDTVSSTGLVNYIRSLAQNKNVIMPSTLKAFSGKLFENTNIKSLELNEGLEFLSNEAFMTNYLESLTIPSTLKFFDKTLFNINTPIKNITILNYKNNPYLDDILNFIVTKLYINEYTNINYFYPRIDNIIFKDELGNIAFTLTKQDLTFNTSNIINYSNELSDSKNIAITYIKSLIKAREGQDLTLKK